MVARSGFSLLLSFCTRREGGRTMDHDKSGARGNWPQEWKRCTNDVMGEAAEKLWGAVTPGLMCRSELENLGENSHYPLLKARSCC